MREAYKLVVVDIGRPSAEFWAMTPAELWWFLEAKKPPKMYGAMSEDEVRQIYEETYGTS